MLGRFDLSSALNVFALAVAKVDVAFASHGISQNSSDNQSQRGRSWSDHCKKMVYSKRC